MIILLLAIILIAGCSSTEEQNSPQTITAAAVAQEPLPEPVIEETKPAAEKTAPDQGFKFACEDGTEVDNPDQCLKVKGGEDAILIIE